jgi:rod shape determining protein RodA
MMFNIFNGRLVWLRSIMVLSCFALVAIGIISIYAAEPQEAFWKKQIIFALLGIACFVLINSIHYKTLGPLSYWIYGIILFLLTILLAERFVPMPDGIKELWRMLIPYRNGSLRWIRIGWGSAYFQVQPSEFCKLAYIIALAWYLRYRKNYRRLAGLVGPFVLTFIAMGLIVLEPDLGTVMLMLPLLFAMLFAAGARVRHLVLIIVAAAMLSPVLWLNMRDYQRMRIASVLLQNEWIYNKVTKSPALTRIIGVEPVRLYHWKRDEGYHLRHSKYAISTGGISGYGFRKGPYSQDKYVHLPESHNDFIFAIIAHQWGLMGCVCVFLLYCVIATCGLEIAWCNTDPFGRLIAVGIVVMFMTQVIVNVGMTIGLMPITGLTLPFVSYGGSSLIVNMTALGLLNNIGRDRPFSVAGKSFEYAEQ